MNSIIKTLFLIVIAAGILLVYSAAYVVDETEQVLITQFGRVVGKPVTLPGLKFKLPFLQVANFFPKNLLTWDGEPGQVPTKDKTYIWVDAFARWKIVDPIKYFQTVTHEIAAIERLDDLIDPAMRNLVTSYPLVESVRNTDRRMDTLESMVDEHKERVQYKVDLGRDEITKRILKQASEKLTQFGIELVDVKIKRINYIENVRDAVYNRMIAERNQIAEKYRAEGQGEASNIRGEKEKELQVIKSQAYKDSQTIKGEADATATKIYADAYSKDPEFYAFVKTMEVYKETLKKDTSLVLSTDSDFMKYFKGIE
ncbi:MAG: protease modulator HflC [Desulfobacula sp.]|jgi:membrane protease subunit HflC|uniref:protease modulator HflC n=1 Tax=Desulfobacula sp. TaxID=2593537 RepID=UPI001DA6FCAA|nr:protease modulator HflC [Desulfobacula sp.]MBT3485164.1 protease modulator HflC [Desulfobacula sp.]MBT3804091.1 protease modulator HflC [Desulfobacula sp.]MBT4025368.1 protease modulator HflC [Desulfobacula sp.]MBT4199480.1 protease modulator HflC [Desulfobacula sp.]